MIVSCDLDKSFKLRLSEETKEKVRLSYTVWSSR